MLKKTGGGVIFRIFAFRINSKKNMKTYTTKRKRMNCALHTVLMVLVCFCPLYAHGQEFLKSFVETNYGIKYIHSIVREVDANTLVVAYDGDCTDPGVCLVEKDSTWAKNILFYHYVDGQLKPHPLSIKDMKVNNDTVFFCGFWGETDYNSINGEGFVGFFPLQGFPNCQVTMFSLGLFTRPTRMEVYTDYHGHTHLLPIWYTTLNKQYHIADFSPHGPSYYEMQMLNNGEQIPSFDIIDDVIALQNYVVISARSSTTHDVTLHYFNFPSSILKRRPLYHYNKSLKITKTHTRSDLAKGENNEFVLSYLVDTNVDHISRVTPIPYQKYSNTLFFDSVVLEKSIIIGLGNESDTICDMVYDKYNHVCDMILKDSNDSKIIHINKNPIVAIPFHRYMDNNNICQIFSLDYLKYHPGQIVSSIHKRTKYSVLVSRYGYNNWSHCGESGNMVYRLYEYTPIVYYINPFVLITDRNGVNQEYILEPIPLYNECEEHAE